MTQSVQLVGLHLRMTLCVVARHPKAKPEAIQKFIGEMYEKKYNFARLNKE
jgi:hypothetical protein